MKVGFIGVGRMGSPMARRLLSAGHHLVVYDLRRDAPLPLVKAGAEPAKSPTQVASLTGVIFTSLPGPKQVRDVMVRPGGLLETIRRKAIVIDTSTVGPSLSRELAASFYKKGAAYLDAPVSGGQEGAAAGTLTVVVGGDERAYRRARPLLKVIGSDLFYMGASGSGSVTKLIVQMIYLSYVAAFCEGLSLGEKSGVPFDKLLEALLKSSAGRPGIEKRYAMLKANDLTPRFEIDSALKDLALALELCAQHHQSHFITLATNEAYQRAKQIGLGDKDLTALRALYRDRFSQRPMGA